MTLNQSPWNQYGVYYHGPALQSSLQTRPHPSIEVPGSQNMSDRTPTSSIAVQDSESNETARSSVVRSQYSDYDERGGSSPTASFISSPGSTSSHVAPSEADENERERDLIGMSHHNVSNSLFGNTSPDYLQRETSPQSMALEHNFPNFLSQGQQSLSPALSAQSHIPFNQPTWSSQTQLQSNDQSSQNLQTHGDMQFMQLTTPPRSAHSPAWSPLRMRVNESVSSSIMWEMDSDNRQQYATSMNMHTSPNQNYSGHPIYDDHAAQYPQTQSLLQANLLSPIQDNGLAYRPGPATTYTETHGYGLFPTMSYQNPLGETPPFVHNLFVLDESASSPASSRSEMEYERPTMGGKVMLPMEEETFKVPVSPVSDVTMLNAQPSAGKSKRTKTNNSSGVRKAAVAQRAGGRKTGTHLKPDKAAQANEMRKTGACWRCTIQRDKCDPDEVCRRCQNRAQRPGLPEFTFGCCRDTLPSLLDFFRPIVIRDLHCKATLETLCQKNVADWDHVEIPIQLTCGRGLPWLEVRSYEFKGKTQELLRQFQYSRDKTTNMLTKIEKRSPPLGITQMNFTRDEGKYDTHVKQIASTFMDNLVKKYYAGEKDDFSKRMFQLLVDIKPRKESEEEKILKEVFHLIINTYILSRTFTIVDEVREEHLSKMKSYRPGIYQNMCSPRMANRQVKHFFSRLHEKTMSSLLNRLQQTFRSSKGCDQWVAAFTVVLGLAIAFEVIQKNVHTILDSKWSHGDMPQKKAEEEAVSVVAEIDRKFEFIMQIFQSKYARTCNPLKDCNNDWSAKIGDMGFLDFMKNLNKLIHEKKNFMQQRVQVGAHCSNWTQYTGRLCSKFLLSFL